MKRVSKPIVAGLGAAAVTMALAGQVWSKPWGEQGRDPQRMLERISAKLELTELQRTEVGTLLEGAYAEGREDRTELRILRQQLREQRGAFDPASAEQIAGEIGTIVGRTAYRRASTDAEMYALLDTEQQAKLDQWLERRDSKRKGWRG
ncbi:MAG: Spy/CpxP family protein refolding chaperone [Pseudomonadota bacterium]